MTTRHHILVRASQRGYSLFEMILVIVIIGILAAITMRSLRGAGEAALTEETRAEMDRLAWAIAGDPGLVSGGHRTDYGYVGDVGALPPTLEALAVNPGLATWRGPYVHDDFKTSAGAPESSFRIDAWGRPYAYAGVAITSTGGRIPLTRRLAPDAGRLLRNTVTVVVTDLADSPPGARYVDSLAVILTVPNGLGGLVERRRTPRPDGFAEFDSVPIGAHLLRLVYTPAADTLRRRVAVEPGQHAHLDLQYPAEVW